VYKLVRWVDISDVGPAPAGIEGKEKLEKFVPPFMMLLYALIYCLLHYK